MPDSNWFNLLLGADASKLVLKITSWSLCGARMSHAWWAAQTWNRRTRCVIPWARRSCLQTISSSTARPRQDGEHTSLKLPWFCIRRALGSHTTSHSSSRSSCWCTPSFVLVSSCTDGQTGASSHCGDDSVHDMLQPCKEWHFCSFCGEHWAVTPHRASTTMDGALGRFICFWDSNRALVLRLWLMSQGRTPCILVQNA